MRQGVFRFFERLGLHLTRVHYYSPIPDTKNLPESTWTRESSLVGIDLNEQGQLALLERFAGDHKSEYDAMPREAPGPDWNGFWLGNTRYGPVDAEVLHCMVRHFKPRRVIEIGSGNSTLLTSHALAMNAKEDPARGGTLTAIEPYPTSIVRRGLPQLDRLIEKPVQQVPMSEFESLGANDILFIDSTHVLSIGSDVQFEFLEILPRLKPGVIVHVHDVFLPREYPRQWIMDWNLFWNEQYLLQAYLMNNPTVRVLWAGHWMHLRHGEKLAAAFGSYSVGGTRTPGSFWFQRIS